MVHFYTYRKSLIYGPCAINFLTQGLLLVTAPGCVLINVMGFLNFITKGPIHVRKEKEKILINVKKIF